MIQDALNGDPLDVWGDVLESLHLTQSVNGPLAFHSPWAVAVQRGGIRLYAVLHGHCLLEGEGLKSPVPLDSGDLIMVTHPMDHRIGDALNSPTVPLAEAIRRSSHTDCRNVYLRDDSATLLLITFSGQESTLPAVLSGLPSFIHIAGKNGNLHWSLEDVVRAIIRESSSPGPGTSGIINRLTHVLFVQAVRLHVASPIGQGKSHSSLLLDPPIGQALRLMLRQPGKSWTVGALASEVGLSRSVFAARFRTRVGQAPLRYLFDYRMRQACRFLRDSQSGIKEIAPRVGYISEAAFSSAFKRWSGTAPAAYRSQVHVTANRV